MDINKTFNASLLAQATYADGLDPNDSVSFFKNDLIDQNPNSDDPGVADGITSAQANYIATNYRVIYQEPTTASGFSATLFQDTNSNNKYTLSFRGTDTSFFGVDWTDANLDNALSGVSRNQVVDMLNFYLLLTQPSSALVKQYQYEEIALDTNQPPPSQPYIPLDINHSGQGFNLYGVLTEIPSKNGLGVINENTQLTVTGHSLGGHLASAFTLLFPAVSQETYTFNSAGFIGWGENEFDTFAHLLKDSVTDIAIQPQSFTTGLSSVTDISATLDYISNLPNQDHLGTHTTVGVETVTVAEVGPIDYVIDNHSIDRISDSLAVINLLHTLDNTITIASANTLIASASNAENTSLEGVMRPLAKLFGQAAIANTDSDHDALYTAISNIEMATNSYDGALVIQSVASLAEHATADNAQGQAYRQAYRYALVNLNAFAITGSESLYTAQANELKADNFTQNYRDDRAAMLSTIIAYNVEDKPYNSLGGPSLGSSYYFHDEVSGITIDPIVPKPKVIFSNQYDVEQGGSENDNIYGGSSENNIQGNGGDDYLEGGGGSDLYIYKPGDGFDTIYDSDGLGNIKWNDHQLSGGKKLSDNTYYDEVNKIYYTFQPEQIGGLTGQLTINEKGKTGGLNITSYTAGELGLTLDIEAVTPATTNKNLIGDVSNEWLESSALALANYIEGLGGNDALNGAAGDDVLDGGDGGDWLYGGTGDDWLVGGADKDFLFTGEGEDTAFGGDGDDFILADATIVPQASFSFEPNTNDYSNNQPNWNDLRTWENIRSEAKSILYSESLRLYDNNRLGIPVAWRYGEAAYTEELADGSGQSISYTPGAGKYGIGTLEVSSIGTNDTDVYHLGFNIFPVVNTDSKRLFGEAGNDVLIGAEANDYLVGGADRDYLQGNAGDDQLFGGTGNDVLIGAAGNDQLDGGEGGDELYGEDGDDYLHGGSGNDLLWGDNPYLTVTVHGDDVLVGGAGDDQLVGGGGVDTLKGGDDQDNLFGEQGDDFLYGGSGGDELRGGEGNDHIEGNGGDDVLLGGQGNDRLFGHSGVDYLEGGDADDLIDGGVGNDQLWGDAGVDTFVFRSGDGVDLINDADGSDVVKFGAGIRLDDVTSQVLILGENRESFLEINYGLSDVVLIKGGYQASIANYQFGGGTRIDTGDFLRATLSRLNIVLNAMQVTAYGGKSDDIITANNLDNTLFGGDGNDQLFGLDGNDTLYGGSGDNILNGGLGNDTFIIEGTGNNVDTVIGGEGNDLILGAVGDDVFRFSEFNLTHSIETIDGGLGVNKLAGTSSNNTLDFSGTNLIGISEIDGGAGNDRITGSQFDDVIIGGSGDDYIRGGDGNDSLRGSAGLDILQGGAGNDTYLFAIGDGNTRISNHDADINDQDKLTLLAGIDPSDVVVVRVGSSLELIIQSTSEVITIDSYFTGHVIDERKLSAITFDDGTVWDGALFNYLVENPTDLADSIRGSTLDDTINGLGGSDFLYGEGGNDTLYGGHGQNTLEGGTGNDFLYGGDGRDALFGGDGNDILEGSAGQDKLFGGLGDDVLRGGGSGHDGVDLGSPIWSAVPGAGGGFSFRDIGDYLEGGLGDDTYIYSFKDDDQILNRITTINNFDSGLHHQDILQFTPEIDPSMVAVSRGYIQSDDDLFLIITGQGKTSELVVNSYFRSADYQLSKIEFSDGTVWDAAKIQALVDETLTNNAPTVANLIDDLSIPENQMLYWTVPANTFNDIDVGDTLTLSAILLDGSALPNWLSFDVNAQTFSGTPGNTEVGLLDIKVTATDAGGLSVEDTFNLTISPVSTSIINGGQTNDNISGTDGVDIIDGGAGHDHIDAGSGNDTMNGGLGDDTFRFYQFNPTHSVETIDGGLGTNRLAGTSYHDKLDFSDTDLIGISEIDAGAGNDHVIGSQLDDIIIGGAGNDTMNGGLGDDTYQVGLGSGKDKISDHQGNDNLAYGLGIEKEDLWFRRAGNDLLIDDFDDNSQVRVGNWYSSDANQLEEIMTATGDVLQNTQVDQLVQAMAAFTPSSSGTLSLSAEERNQISSVIVANWE